MRAAAAPSTISDTGMWSRLSFPGGQTRTLKPGTGFIRIHPADPALLVPASNHSQGRAIATCRQCTGITMRDHRRHRANQFRTQIADAYIIRLVLADVSPVPPAQAHRPLPRRSTQQSASENGRSPRTGLPLSGREAASRCRSCSISCRQSSGASSRRRRAAMAMP